MSVQSQEWRACPTGLGGRKCHDPLVMSAGGVTGKGGVCLVLPQAAGPGACLAAGKQELKDVPQTEEAPLCWGQEEVPQNTPRLVPAGKGSPMGILGY